jgi:PAS domain S-box-containing protein
MNPEKIKYEELLKTNAELRKVAVFQENTNDSIFKQLSENIDDVFWLRTDKKMIYINPAFEKIWGFPCEDIYQNPQIFTETIHPADKDKVNEILKSKGFIETGYFEYEYRIIRPDKQIR